MTREEAIESLKSIIDTHEMLEEKQVNSDVPLDGEDIEALDMAISALSTEPCEDCISRTEVIKAIDEREDVNGKVNAEDIRTDIVTMPSVQPTKKGELYIDKPRGYQCQSISDMRGKSCNTCKNSDDEFSGECYECLKGIFDHYEPEAEKAESEDKE